MVAFSTRRALAPAVLCILLSACGGSETEADAALDADALENIAAQTTQAVCSDSAPGFARCHSFILTGSVAPDATGKPKGLGAADLASAYNLPKTGASATVAIVDAYDDPNAEADLAVYRKQYGLAACTSKSGCFKKVGQSGSATLPKADAGWAQEIALDLDMSAPPARRARSCSSKPAHRPWPTSARPSTPRSSWAPSRSPTAGAARRLRRRPLSTPGI
jgi:hypothetical protein